AVSGFGPDDIARLLADAGIVRNRAKIEAAIANAQAALRLPGGLAELVWQYRDDEAKVPVSLADVPSMTSQSKALAKDLRRRGLRSPGPFPAYATMQACGIVNDHLADCVSRDGVASARASHHFARH